MMQKTHTLSLALAALFFFSTAALAISPPPVTQWHVAAGSTINFTATQMGTPFGGSFNTFASTIFFDEKHLAHSSAAIEIQMASVATKAADRDEAVKSPVWFDVAKFPVATFKTTAFRKKEDGNFEADGDLTIRDITLPVTLSFTLKIEPSDSGNQKALVTGTALLDRSKFKLGHPDWAATDVIGNEVTVSIDLTAFSMKP